MNSYLFFQTQLRSHGPRKHFLPLHRVTHSLFGCCLWLFPLPGGHQSLKGLLTVASLLFQRVSPRGEAWQPLHEQCGQRRASQQLWRPHDLEGGTRPIRSSHGDSCQQWLTGLKPQSRPQMSAVSYLHHLGPLTNSSEPQFPQLKQQDKMTN